MVTHITRSLNKIHQKLAIVIPLLIIGQLLLDIHTTEIKLTDGDLLHSYEFIIGGYFAIIMISMLLMLTFLRKLLKHVESKLEGYDSLKKIKFYELLWAGGATFISSLFVMVSYLVVIPMKQVLLMIALNSTLTIFWSASIKNEVWRVTWKYALHRKAYVVIPVIHFLVFIVGVCFLRASENYFVVVIHGVFLVFYSPMSIDIWIAARQLATHGSHDLENHVEVVQQPQETQNEEDAEETWI